MLRGRTSSTSYGSKTETSLLSPPNPLVVSPGSSPVSRGGILLNPNDTDGAPTTCLPHDPDLASESGQQQRKQPAPSPRRRLGSSLGRRSTSVSSSGLNVSTRYRSPSTSRTEGGAAGEQLLQDQQPVRCKFGPLPETGRIKRSNSITLGVAARAQLLQGANVGGSGGGGQRSSAANYSQPHWQQSVPQAHMWYNTGQLPDNVKTYKDLKPGLKKAWSTLTRRLSTEGAAAETGMPASPDVTPAKDDKKAQRGEQSQIEDVKANGTAAPNSNLPANAGGGAKEEGAQGGRPIMRAASLDSNASARYSAAGSEGDISSINEEDEDEESDLQNADGAAKMTGEGLVVRAPPTLQNNEGQHPPAGYAESSASDSDLDSSGRLRADSLASSTTDVSNSSYAGSETDEETREGAFSSAQGLSSSPGYVPGARGMHYYNHAPGHGHLQNSGTRSGEATPRSGRSPPGTPGLHHYTQHAHALGHGVHGSYLQPGGASNPGSGANTPRRRMSLSDAQSRQQHSQAMGGMGTGGDTMEDHSAVFGFDEQQLKQRLGAMDLSNNSYQRHGRAHGAQQPQQEASALVDGDGDEQEEDVPLPVGSKQVQGAGYEVAI